MPDFWKLETEFVSPIALSRCIRRLESLQDNGLLLSIRVYVKRIDEQQARFEIREWYALNFLAEVSGDLTSQDDNFTAVYAQATFNRRVFAVWLLALVFFCLLLLMVIDEGDPLRLVALLLAIPFNLLLLRWLFHARQKILALVETMLQTDH